MGRISDAYQQAAKNGGWACLDCRTEFWKGQHPRIAFARLVAHLAVKHRRLPKPHPKYVWGSHVSKVMYVWNDGDPS